ncbi:hypothetical protein C1N70_26655 (plasmid) [Cytobacillus firmus]
MKTNKKQEQNRLYKHGIHMSEDIIKMSLEQNQELDIKSNILIIKINAFQNPIIHREILSFEFTF